MNLALKRDRMIYEDSPLASDSDMKRRPTLTLDDVDEKDSRKQPLELSKETDLGSASKEEDVQNVCEMSDFPSETQTPKLNLDALRGFEQLERRQS